MYGVNKTSNVQFFAFSTYKPNVQLLSDVLWLNPISQEAARQKTIFAKHFE